MKHLSLRWVIMLVALLPLQAIWAQSVRELGLNDVLNVALEKENPGLQGGSARDYQSSSWLAALPSISVSYLDSAEKYGTDEAQMSLNLPIKSGTQRRADTELKRLSVEYKSTSKQLTKLYLSGLIREALWSYREAEVRREAAAQKYQLLSQLEQQYKQLLAANIASEFSLLLIQKELVVAEIEQHNHDQQLKRWLQQYEAVTGLGSIPSVITEPSVKSEDYVLSMHPQFKLLELAWLQKQQILMAASNQAMPWNVSLTAKNVDSLEYEEDQYGIEIEIPLTFIKTSTQSHNSEWLVESRNFSIARDELQLGLQRQWQLLSGESVLLRRKHTLLEKSGELSQRITDHTTELEAVNELGEELILRQRIEAIDSKTAMTINKILIEQNNAMRRQAAGISL